MIVYTGYWKEGMIHYLERWPGLKYAHESMLDRVGRENPEALNGLWVNNSYLLMGVPPESVVIVGSDGTEARLVDHPKWDKWKDEFLPGEFYTFIKAGWPDAEEIPAGGCPAESVSAGTDRPSRHGPGTPAVRDPCS